MRRLRLQGQNERLLREAVRGMLSETGVDVKAQMRAAGGAAAAWLLAKPPAGPGPFRKGTVGRVFYPERGFFGSFSTTSPFLVVARKGVNDAFATAYLLLFETPADAMKVVQSLSEESFYPPSFRTPSNDEIDSILGITGLVKPAEVKGGPQLSVSFPEKDEGESVSEQSDWTSIDMNAALRLRDTIKGDNTRLRVIEEIPASITNPVIAGRPSMRLGSAEKLAHGNAGEAGYQKLWRLFGEPAQQSWVDAIVTGLGLSADLLGVAAEFLTYDRSVAIASKTAAAAPYVMATLVWIHESDELWSISSIAFATVTAFDSWKDWDRVRGTEKLSVTPGITSKSIDNFKGTFYTDAACLVLSVLAAGADEIKDQVVGEIGRGSDAAAAVEGILRFCKATLTLYNSVSGGAAALKFWEKEKVALAPHKDTVLAAIDSLKTNMPRGYDPNEMKRLLDVFATEVKTIA